MVAREKIKFHLTLAEYFTQKSLYLDESVCRKPDARKLMELPWQLTIIHDWASLSKLLVSPDFMKELNNIKLYEYVTTVLTYLNQSSADAKELYKDFFNPTCRSIQILK